MGSIYVDTSPYVARHLERPGVKDPALWTFAIQDRHISFWGRYPEALNTAERFARAHGMKAGKIALLECTGTFEGGRRAT